jgi:hypothetical protein
MGEEEWNNYREGISQANGKLKITPTEKIFGSYLCNLSNNSLNIKKFLFTK